MASPASTVVHGNARFTILYPNLVRMEYSVDGSWIDSATMAIVNRLLPVPSYTVQSVNVTAITIVTEAMKVTYDSGTVAGGFTSANLNIKMLHLQSGNNLWRPGQRQTWNLNGTYHSLDCYGSENGTSPVNNCMNTIYPGGEAQQVNGWSNRMMGGLLARDGWNLYADDASNGALQIDSGARRGQRSAWYELPPTTHRADWYFHTYGSDFRLALKQMATLAGPPGLPPRWALGVWWSREYLRHSIVLLSTTQSQTIGIMHQLLTTLCHHYDCLPSSLYRCSLYIIGILCCLDC